MADWRDGLTYAGPVRALAVDQPRVDPPDGRVNALANVVLAVGKELTIWYRVTSATESRALRRTGCECTGFLHGTVRIVDDPDRVLPGVRATFR